MAIMGDATPELMRVGDAYTVVLPFGAAPPGVDMAAGLTRPDEGRSPHWAKLERETVQAHPYCACCGGTSELQVHHVVPFHLDAAKELDPANLIVLCRRDHLLFGPLCSWRSWNEAVRQDVAAMTAKIGARP